MASTDPIFVVNCTKDFPMVSKDGIRIPVNDDGSKEALDGMLMAFSSATNQIEEWLLAGRRVVVHCLAGQQRSPAVIAAFLMDHRSFGLQEAIRYIRCKKPDAFFWHVNFRDPLERYAILLGNVVRT